jgi:hypothetical protein
MKLTPITKPQDKPVFAVCDIETMNWTKFIVLGFFDGNNYLEFRRLKSFFKYLEQGTAPKTVFAHFGGKFDFLFLIKEILKNENYKIDVIVPRGSSLLYFECTLNGHSYTFRDSSALLPFSLKSITENFGVDNIKLEYDHSKTTGYSKVLSSYLESDCRGLYQSLEKFFAWPLVTKAGHSATIAGQAMRVFRTYIKKEIYGLGKFETDFIRPAYLGGRTEIFRPLCREPIYEYDVNSLYPYVMLSNYYPIGKSHFTFTFVREKLGVYKAEVETPEEISIPCLGVVFDNKYVFPAGRFRGMWTSVELEYAISQGYKVKILEGIVFDKKEKLFHDFITDLYNIRLTSPKNSVSDIMAKLLMNSSYGRFGMNPDKENIGFTLKHGVEEYQIVKLGKHNIQLYKEPVNLETFTHVAIAAFITSYARIHMHKLFGHLGNDLYYTDTDSIFTTRELPCGKELGALKHESTYDSAIFLLPKTYFATGIKNKIAMKGFDKRKIVNFTFEDFKTGLEGDLRKFKIYNDPKFATFKTALAQKKLVTMTKKSEKQLKATYKKRIIFNKDGEFYTKPITLKE